jgi:polar amino acid transport system permease protein
MLPSMVSQFVSTIKETSLGYVISANEVTYAASQVNNQVITKPFEVYGLLALTYFTLCFSLTSVARWLERRVARERGGAVIAQPEPAPQPA